MTTEIRDKAGWIRQCPHAAGSIVICSLCLMREADRVDLRISKTLQTRIDLRLSLSKAKKALGATQAQIARLMQVSAPDLSHAKTHNKAIPNKALKWLEQQGFLVMRNPNSAQ